MVAGLGIAAIIVGEIALLAWVVAEPRSRHMRKEVHSEVSAPAVPVPEPTTVRGPAGMAAGPETPVPARPAADAVLNRRLKIQRVERLDAADSVGLRVLVRGQVGERALDPAAVGVSVEWVGPVGQTIWLQIPAVWDNFSAKTLTARWAGPAPQLRGYIVRTYYHGTLQDVFAQPPALAGPAPAVP